MKNTENTPLVVLAGNPNSGKTTVFNKISGLNKKTGNWSGVTVDSQYCAVNYEEQGYSLVDLPGIFALSLDSQGEDEAHVLDFLNNNKPDLVVNVINSACLKKSLFLTLEMLELNIPMLLVLNMADEAQAHNIQINKDKLGEILGVQAIEMVATKNTGITELKEAINKYLRSPQEVFKTKQNKQHKTTQETKESLEECFNNRLKKAENIANAVQTIEPNNKKAKSKLDYFTTHPIWGLLSFVVAMYIMFFFAINISAVFVDFFDIASGAIFIDGTRLFLSSIGLPESITAILADGLGSGIQTVATFIPVIGFLYLALSWFEGSGYMARAAFVMNGYMKKLGLSGQTFVPLIISFGCNVPAIAATRTLSSKRERLITIMMAPFMSCGARLSVYALLVAAFFSHVGSLVVMALYFLGILVAILTGVMLHKTVLKGKAEPFVIELPSWKNPGIKNLFIGTWIRLKGFLVSAGKIIVIMAAILQILNSVGKDFSWNNSNTENSMLSVVAKAATPVFEPMGIEEENWPAVVGIITGILAKEVVVGTLDSLYSEAKEDASEISISGIGNDLLESVQSIATNFVSLGEQILDPLGLSSISSNTEDVIEQQGVSNKTFGVIKDKFQDRYAVFAYLIFILLYVPCVATIAAISKEAGSRWAVFAAVWSTSLAYLSATNFYQLSRFSTHPVKALFWLLLFVIVITGFYQFLKRYSKKPIDSIKLNTL